MPGMGANTFHLCYLNNVKAQTRLVAHSLFAANDPNIFILIWLQPKEHNVRRLIQIIIILLFISSDSNI